MRNSIVTATNPAPLATSTGDSGRITCSTMTPSAIPSTAPSWEAMTRAPTVLNPPPSTHAIAATPRTTVTPKVRVWRSLLRAPGAPLAAIATRLPTATKRETGDEMAVSHRMARLRGQKEVAPVRKIRTANAHEATASSQMLSAQIAPAMATVTNPIPRWSLRSR